MEFLSGLIFGVLGGTLTLIFIQGSTKNKREYEIYMEGYLAGQAEAVKEGVKV